MTERQFPKLLFWNIAFCCKLDLQEEARTENGYLDKVSLRQRSLSSGTVKRLVWQAWIEGTLLPSTPRSIQVFTFPL
jgi:hypothetical protein